MVGSSGTGSGGNVGSKRTRSGIALCLSGGGYRAALFHSGALRRLHEFKILERVDMISSVSGGSIFAAFLAKQLVAKAGGGRIAQLNWEQDIAAPFRTFVRHDLRTWPILLHLPWNWAFPGIRIRHLQWLYRRYLTALKLKELPTRPEFTFCATDLTFGVNWEFRRNEAGDYQAGYTKDAAEWPIARAVAASSSFPPLFGPMPIRSSPTGFKGGGYRGLDRVRLLRRLRLSDGGVYDNMGLEPVWKKFQYVLISDCGAPFEFTVGTNPIKRLLRLSAVITNQACAQRKRAFFTDINNKVLDGAYWPLKRVVQHPSPGSAFGGYSEELVGDVVAKIRTDLNRFSEAECMVLENHGYTIADEAIRRRVPSLSGQSAVPFGLPHPAWADEPSVRRHLRSSHRQVSIRRFWSWLRGER